MTACFHCKNSLADETPINGWNYRCQKGLPIINGTTEDILDCPQVSLRLGFQIGGYWSHMWFEESGGCLEWMICSNGEFSTPQPEIQFHICDFKQLEKFVTFWGKTLRQRGWLKDDTSE